MTSVFVDSPVGAHGSYGRGGGQTDVHGTYMCAKSYLC